MLGRRFSSDVFPLTELGSSFFTSGQKYKIDFVVSIPVCPRNHDIDMSLVTLHLYSLKGNHSKSLSNTFLPFYRPWLIETMELIAFAPLYFFNIWQKEQKIIVSLSENFYDDVEFPTGSGELIMETNGLVWYTATLSIFAVLSPFSWLLYHYYWTTEVVFVIAGIFTVNFVLFFIKLLRDCYPSSRKFDTPSQQIMHEKEQDPTIESLYPSCLSLH
ncbi:unnamed protein product [Hymenolepis diminuta]|nr:unnamed protein product [Hymenolepis diminuta]VUZ42242.1 unnamed protein product [Hymenolepis diminuta]